MDTRKSTPRILALAAAAALAAALITPGCSSRAGAQDRGASVARVDGQVVTDAELTAEARGSLAEVEARYAEEVHAAKARALDRLIEKRLLEAAAKRQGLSVEALLEREVASRIPEAPETYLQAVYDQTKANGRAVPPFQEVKAEIAAFVRGQDLQKGRARYVAKLRSEAKVENLLPPLLPAKVEVKADGPARGGTKAPVTIVEFSDYQCEFCGSAEATIRRVVDAYKGDVRLVMQSFPLSIHPDAQKASEAALCAGEQGRYWDMHDTLFAHQQALKPEDLKRYAAGLGLDAASFGACLDTGRTSAAVEASRKLGESLGVSSTPLFFVNGRPLVGAQPFERLKEIVDFELTASKR